MNPLSIRAMIRAVEHGSACIIFPEGRITTTGALMKVYEGPAVIAERTKAALVCVRIDGVEFTPFSRLAGRVRRRWFPKIRVCILPPRRLTTPDGLGGRRRRAALRRSLGDDLVAAMFAAAPVDTTLFGALVEARHHGGRHLVADDLEMRPMTYNALLTASYALGSALARRTRRGERVGVLLPTSRASVVTFFALQAEGRRRCTIARSRNLPMGSTRRSSSAPTRSWRAMHASRIATISTRCVTSSPVPNA
jgi:acyl-[acyl-carrier-protein]-phospholipid O-acyltransferase / long-chain-fatty-acid--[acyl-carrier-protein] ligase